MSLLPKVEVRGLGVELGGQVILRDVSLDVSPGTMHAIVGPNGAGKTTLIRSLLGAVPHRGHVALRFEGPRRVGYVPQRLDFDRRVPVTVRDFLSLVRAERARLWGPPRRGSQIEELLHRTGCPHVVDRRMGSLSGGELRRVLLAQALSPLPELLLLDEPTSQVDQPGTILYEDVLRELRDAHGVTLILVGHDLERVARMADAVTGLNREVRYSGSPQGLTDPVHLARIFGPVESRAGPPEAPSTPASPS